MASSNRKQGRRSFLVGAAALGGAGLASRRAAGFVPAHNWDRYDWGTAPPVRDRLNQGPFPQYPPEEVLPGSDVVMATTPSDDVVPGYGKGLVTYPEEYWKVALAAARQHGKRVGFRVMMSDPDIAGPALPDFVLRDGFGRPVCPSPPGPSGRGFASARRSWKRTVR